MCSSQTYSNPPALAFRVLELQRRATLPNSALCLFESGSLLYRLSLNTLCSPEQPHTLIFLSVEWWQWAAPPQSAVSPAIHNKADQYSSACLYLQPSASLRPATVRPRLTHHKENMMTQSNLRDKDSNRKKVWASLHALETP